MKFNKLILLVLLAVLSVSCSDDDDDNNNNGQDIYLVTKISMTNNSQDITIIEFTYDSQNRVISSIPNKSFDTPPCNYVYNSNGELTKFVLKFEDNSKREYNVTYRDSKNIEVHYMEDGIDRYDTYELNNDGLLYKFTENPDGDDNTYLVFEYDSKGNVLKMTDEEGRYRKYTYDNNNGFLKDLTLPQWITFYTIDILKTPNNRLTLEDYDKNDQLEDGTQTYKYTYNEVGYPISYLYEYGPEKNNYKIDYKIVKK